MKRTIAIFLLIIMSLTSVHTTWAFHYCGGSLHSVGIANSKSDGCCDKAGMEDHTLPNTLYTVSQPEKSCCLNHLVEVSTDDYSVSQQQVSIVGACHVFVPLLYIPDRTSQLNTPEKFPNLQYIFPPGGLAKYGVDLLTAICIFRI